MPYVEKINEKSKSYFKRHSTFKSVIICTNGKIMVKIHKPKFKATWMIGF